MPSASHRNALGAAVLMGLLAACAPTDYEPAGSPGGTGYWTTQVSPDRYLVSFEGNAATSRETVETYLLFRAAQVADQTGHPWFALVEHETERDVTVDVYRTQPGFYGYGPGLGPLGAYGFPYYGTFPYPAAPTVTTRESYEAFAAVRMFDTRPDDRDDAFRTDAVIETLRPRIEFE
ncbi:hypothetical protein C882_1102 [Caenispirillum salinarum AK4]|uniref:Lipoprotein n=1 Tax=Caenispirillum salinarum AK4 TaxID=1238182 RepID=K9HHL0_9PROT|nr:hypothetical protein [Caenispirillum salinarum]EKV28101.1 hypothetical protein C882_1102 [Caenispirillum salinarum AK4]